MSKKILFLAVAILSVQTQAAEDPKCDAALAPDISVLHTNDSVFLSLLQVIDESNYEKFQEKYSADVPQYFSGDYGKFKEARNNYYKSTNLKLNIFQSRNVLQANIPEGRAKIWLECVTNNGSGIFVYVHDVDNAGATLKVKWVPPAGLGNLRSTAISIDNGTFLPNGFTNSQSFVGEADIILRRSTPGGSVRGAISGTSGNSGSYSKDFYIPSTPKPYKVIVNDSDSSLQFDNFFLVPRTPLPKDVTFTLQSLTTQTGEHFTQCCRFIQQYVWVNDVLKYDSSEVAFAEGETKTLTHQETITVPAGKQVTVKIRNNGKGAKMGSTELRWNGELEMMK